MRAAIRFVATLVIALVSAPSCKPRTEVHAASNIHFAPSIAGFRRVDASAAGSGYTAGYCREDNPACIQGGARDVVVQLSAAATSGDALQSAWQNTEPPHTDRAQREARRESVDTPGLGRGLRTIETRMDQSIGGSLHPFDLRLYVLRAWVVAISGALVDPRSSAERQRVDQFVSAFAAQATP